MERAATLAESNLLGPESLPSPLRGVPDVTVSTADLALGADFSIERHLDELERRYLVSALKRAEGVKSRAAELLGLTFRSFRYRLAKHGLTDDTDRTGP